MGEKNKLLRELLSENTIEDLRTFVNFKRQMKKPKSTVKRMVDYLKQNPMPLVPQTKVYERAFKINIVNDRDPLLSCKKHGIKLVYLFKRLKVEMGGFK